MRSAGIAIRLLAALLFAAATSISAVAQGSAPSPIPDDRLRQAVIGRMMDARAGFFADIQLDVIGGDALLTGRVRSLQDKAQASALVRSVPGIQAVINEIHVGATDDVKRITADLLIERRIRVAMHAAFNGRMPNLTWHVTNGVAYIFGLARTEWEHNRALAVAKQAQGVSQVVDHLRIVPNGG